MIHEILQWVEVWDDEGDPLGDLCAKIYFSEKDLYMADKFSSLVTGGNKTAKVRREISETIGGPRFSAVKVMTSIEVTCDQSESVIKAAAEHALAEATILNEEGITAAYAGLLAHRKKLGLEE